jgi:hypothetical protein
VLTFWFTIGFCTLAFVVLVPFCGFAPESQNVAATLMFDTFAVFVQTKMLSALYCNYSNDPPLLVATETNSDPLVCWEGLHLLYGTIALIVIPVLNISSVFVKFRIRSRQSVVAYDLWFVAVQQQLLLLAATMHTFFGDHSPYVLLATLMLCSSTMLLLALFYSKTICNVALLTHCNRVFWAMAWWTSAMALVSQVLTSHLHSSGFTLFLVFYIGLLAIITISCFAWVWWPRASFTGTNLSFFGVKRYLQGLTEEEKCVKIEPALERQNMQREHINNSYMLSGRIDWWATKHNASRHAWRGKEEGEEEKEEEEVVMQTQLQVPLLLSSTSITLHTPRSILIPPKTGQRCIEASTMHTIVDHIQKCSNQDDATYKLTLSNVGLEAGSLKPLATFLVGYLQLKGGCCTNPKLSEVAVMCNDAQECCINPHSFICFCCFLKPQDIQRGLFNCLQCVSKPMPRCPIKSLSLASNELGRKTKALQLIRDMLKGSHSLTHIDISNNELGAKSVWILADGVCR